MPVPVEPKIYCAYSRLIPVSELQPHPKNPKSHPESQIALFKEVIRGNGIRRPITVSKQSGFVVSGHGLLQTLIALGIEAAPVDFQDFKDEAHELAHLAADNKLAELGIVNEVQLGKVVKQMEDSGLDACIAGIVAEIETTATLKEVVIQPPPKMAWVLLGVPIVKFGAVQALLDQMPQDTVIHTTSNDNE